jgi:hypothetical protein
MTPVVRGNCYGHDFLLSADGTGMVEPFFGSAETGMNGTGSQPDLVHSVFLMRPLIAIRVFHKKDLIMAISE